MLTPQRRNEIEQRAEHNFDACPVCRHPWSEHDQMGDCHHLDARRSTGSCNCGHEWRDAPRSEPEP